MISGSGQDVGLPSGQMGNSEVGHMNLGAGRVVYQDLTRISLAIETGEFAANPVIESRDRCRGERRAHCTCSVCFRPGGVHSQEDHIFALIAHAASRGAKRIYLHAFLDGRDTPPKSAAASLARADARIRKARRRPDGVDRRALLRDGPRPALGPRRTRLQPARFSAKLRSTRRTPLPRSKPPISAAKATSSCSRPPYTPPTRCRSASWTAMRSYS